MHFRHLLPVLAAGLLLPHLALAQQPMPPLGDGPPGGSHGIPMAITKSIKRKFLNLAYAPVSPAQKLDIYLPDSGLGPFPVIIAIHGGAFKFGDKADAQVNPMLQGVQRGYAVVCVNYRLSGEARFPANIEDVKAAIRFVRANARKYHLNPNRLATWGNSAGGNLAALAGTTGDVAAFDEARLSNAGQSSRVQAVVDWYGPIQFDQLDAQFRVSGKGAPTHDDPASPESAVLGKPVQQDPDLTRRASPATYITPPFPSHPVLY